MLTIEHSCFLPELPRRGVPTPDSLSRSSNMVTLAQFPVLGKSIIVRMIPHYSLSIEVAMTHGWQEVYKAAVFETDWQTKMEKRIQAAEAEIQTRQRVLLESLSATPEEWRALADAL